MTTSNNNKHWHSMAKKCNAQQNRQAQCTTDSTSTTDLTREAQAQSTTDSTSLLLWSVVISTCALCVIPPSCRICTMPYRVVPHPSVVLIFFQLMKLSTGEISDSEFPHEIMWSLHFLGAFIGTKRALLPGFTISKTSSNQVMAMNLNANFVHVLRNEYIQSW